MNIRKEYIEHFKKLNYKFHNKQLLTEFFYDQLSEIKIDFKKSILISIFPDSDNTYVGKVINQNGNIIDFDMDLDNKSYTEWKDSTEEFMNSYKKDKNSGQITEILVAWDYYKKHRAGNE